MLHRIHSVAALTIALMACADQPLGPDPMATTQPGTPAAAPAFGEANAASDWNGVARGLIAANNSSPFVAIRGLAILSVAQHNAAVAAEQSPSPGVRPSVRAAIGAASVAVLSYLYPAASVTLETRLDDVLALPGWPGDKHADPAAGEAIGQAVGAAVVARAQGDGFFAPWSGTIPTGPGIWSSPTPPAGPGIGQAQTWFLLSGSQFRPAPPPAFNSPEFLAALAEVRQISDTRTPEQHALAVYWNAPAGTYTPPGIWNEEAVRLATQYSLNERRTAHLLALMNMVSYDAVVASHEAKYHYWLLRPTQADPLITTSFGVPNFPAYPSNHAAISAGMARIIADRFPSERARLDALAEEASLSRVYGGIHYRFDGDAGLELGRKVAAWALAHDVNGHRPFPLD
jgi:membrane-associated phospholipid phosphatase